MGSRGYVGAVLGGVLDVVASDGDHLAGEDRAEQAYVSQGPALAGEADLVVHRQPVNLAMVSVSTGAPASPSTAPNETPPGCTKRAIRIRRTYRSACPVGASAHHTRHPHMRTADSYPRRRQEVEPFAGALLARFHERRAERHK